MRGAGGGPDHVKCAQARIQKGADRFQVAKRRHAADGKPGLFADQGGIGLAQRLARQCRGFGRVHPVAARSQKQDCLAGILAAENHRLGDLVNRAADHIGGLLGGVGRHRYMQDLDRQTHRRQMLFHAFQTFAHAGIYCRAGRDVQGLLTPLRWQSIFKA